MATCSVFPDDRHRVKLHPMLGDPDADYINANYIDVSGLSLSSLLAWPCPLQAHCPGRAETCWGIKGGFKWLDSERPHLLESV